MRNATKIIICLASVISCATQCLWMVKEGRLTELSGSGGDEHAMFTSIVAVSEKFVHDLGVALGIE